MTSAVLSGKPNARKTCIRFDDGDAASAKLRRGSPLCKVVNNKNSNIRMAAKVSTHCPVAMIGALAMFAPLVVSADSYSLATGDSASFTDADTHTYDSVAVAGDLSIGSNTKFISTGAVSLSGGTVTIDGSSSVFGKNQSDSSITVTYSPAADGSYTKVTVQNGQLGAITIDGMSGSFYNFSGKDLTIAAENAASNAKYPDGMIPFLELKGASANFHQVQNNSSLTGLVTVVGSAISHFGHLQSWLNGSSFFKNGSFRLNVESGATLRFNAKSNRVSYNAAGCGVHVVGAGNLQFLDDYQSGTDTTKLRFRRGAALDVEGVVSFDGTGASSTGWFCFDHDDVFGHNVGTVQTGGINNGKVVLEVTNGVAVTVHDFAANREKDSLVGAGTIRIDASAAARSFAANIPATYGSGTVNAIGVAKFGANEAVLAVTNLPMLKIESGAVRITNDCFVAILSGAAGATIIADGCTVTLGSGTVSADGLSFETRNGGEFAVGADAGRTTVYGPGAIGSAIHAISGDLVFSAFGITQKYLRWTFRKTKTSPNSVWIDRLWIFDTDGNLATPSMTRASDNATTLSAGQACWVYSSATNIALDPSAVPSYQGADRLATYVLGGKLSNYNNYFKCSSPVVDPEDADSWLGIEMRLADDVKNLTGYNMMAPSKEHYPTSWTVESSDDGETWTVLDTHDDYVINPYSQYETYAWYDGVYQVATVNEHFKFSGYKSDGLSADASEAVSLQVDTGATVDLTAYTVAPQKIGGISYDVALGGGVIRGGALIAGGRIDLANFDAANPAPLSLELDGTIDIANLSSWRVFVDGVERTKYVPKYHPSTKEISLIASGLIIVVK
jgi:hypothetical protein